MSYMGKNKKIAARVTADTYDLIEELASRDEISRSAVIELAVRSYASSRNPLTSRALLSKLDESGFLGGVTTDESLSINYKKVLAGALDRKYGHR